MNIMDKNAILFENDDNATLWWNYKVEYDIYFPQWIEWAKNLKLGNPSPTQNELKQILEQDLKYYIRKKLGNAIACSIPENLLKQFSNIIIDRIEKEEK